MNVKNDIFYVILRYELCIHRFLEVKMAINIGIKTFERNEFEANLKADKRWYYHILVGNG